MYKRKTNAVGAVYLLFCLLLITIGGVFVYKFTNGFEEDFKTFYVEVDGQEVLSTAGGYNLDPRSKLRADIKYTFARVDNSKKGYTINVVPHTDKDTNFSFTVDEELVYFSEVKNLLKAFKVERFEDYFTITTIGDVEDVIKAAYGSENVVIDTEDFYADMFELEVYSYNGKSKISLYFSVPDEIPSVAIDTEIIMF